MLPPDILPDGLITGTSQVYVVPVGIMLPIPLAGTKLKALPLQMVSLKTVVTRGTGLTTMIYVYSAPAQVAAPDMVALPCKLPLSGYRLNL